MPEHYTQLGLHSLCKQRLVNVRPYGWEGVHVRQQHCPHVGVSLWGPITQGPQQHRSTRGHRLQQNLGSTAATAAALSWLRTQVVTHRVSRTEATRTLRPAG